MLKTLGRTLLAYFVFTAIMVTSATALIVVLDWLIGAMHRCQTIRRLTDTACTSVSHSTVIMTAAVGFVLLVIAINQAARLAHAIQPDDGSLF
jgi:hypothetical protein